MKIKNSQFGEIEFDEQIIIPFPEGIIGFEDLKRFIIIEDEDCKPFRWLISVDEPEIGFAVLEPSLLIEDYYLRSGFDPNVYVLFVIATLSKDISKITVNLKAPVVIDKTRNLGRQVILENSEFEISHHLFM
ncbi:MAG: flagellar assembly protein FliW [Candidatus Kryptonium sp.]|nr:flagellar assembly protein FliW [Candidatus Kryptonium sp.]MCX7762075.1 flagellar assembly protein FliW [Candidatus Kryptonium sp.]MDW8108321.1 flagellar assembly protein FliW [Candidatus Kryptonium sp.]